MDLVVTNIIEKSKNGQFQDLEKQLEKFAEIIALSPLDSVAYAVKGCLGDAPELYTMGLVYLVALRPLRDEFTLSVETIIDRGSPAQLFGRPFALARFRSLIYRYAEHQVRHDHLMRGINYTLKAATLFRPGDQFLTPAHGQCMMLCLRAKKYAFATRVLGERILTISGDSTGVNATDYLLFQYYGGLIYGALHRYSEAIRCMESCLNTPGSTVSAIAVEAYKKYLLLGLIADGKVRPMPKRVSTFADRMYTSFTTEYIELASAIESRDTGAIEKLLRDHRDHFDADHNLGLIHLTLRSMTEKAILSLTKVYVTLSIKEIALQSGIAEELVTPLLVKMIGESSVYATISKSEGIVSFHDADRVFVASSVERKMESICQLLKLIEAERDDVRCSLPYAIFELQSDPKFREIMAEYAASRPKKTVLGAVADAIKASVLPTP